MGPDAAEEKSLIPCLEPCAILLEFARKALRLEQEEKVAVSVSPGEVETLQAALEMAPSAPLSAEREADFNSPANPRRLQLALEKLKPLALRTGSSDEPEGAPVLPLACPAPDLRDVTNPGLPGKGQ